MLSRVTVEESGCQLILTHSKHQDIFRQLLLGLNMDDPSRATNAAFAIGRLMESNEGKQIIVADCEHEKLVSSSARLTFER
jgi:hypothetical protein